MSPSSRAEQSVSRTPAGRANVFTRFNVFIAQIIAELRKVVRPTREQLVSYTMVVILFVLVMMTFVFALDQAFIKLIAWTFGK